MNSRFAYLRERLRTSLWPIPAALCLAGGVTAVLMLWLDTRFQITVDDSPWSALGNDTVQRVIAVIAGSIIGVGGVAFSITMVALTLTSGQYGPKILRNFLEDRTSKVTLGLFLGSYAYSLITLSGFTLVETPRFSLLGALASAFAALFAFVQFMHRTATDLQADQIVQRIGRQLHHTLSDMADVKHGPRRSDDTAHWRRATRGCRRFELAATQHGYVQAIDYQGLSRLCAKHDCTLMVRARAGDFLIGGLGAFSVYAANQREIEGILQETRRHVVVGPVRTPVQDAEHAISQLSQLAARALSPGINDPGTAITCIDWFTRALAEIVDRDLPGCIVSDDEGNPRLLIRTPRFAGLAKAIYAPMRQLADANIAVCIRLLESLCGLAELTRRPERLAVLQQHGDLILDSLQDEVRQSFDARDIQQRYRRLRARTSC